MVVGTLYKYNGIQYICIHVAFIKMFDYQNSIEDYCTCAITCEKFIIAKNDAKKNYLYRNFKVLQLIKLGTFHGFTQMYMYIRNTALKDEQCLILVSMCYTTSFTHTSLKQNKIHLTEYNMSFEIGQRCLDERCTVLYSL